MHNPNKITDIRYVDFISCVNWLIMSVNTTDKINTDTCSVKKNTLLSRLHMNKDK